MPEAFSVTESAFRTSSNLTINAVIIIHQPATPSWHDLQSELMRSITGLHHTLLRDSPTIAARAARLPRASPLAQIWLRALTRAADRDRDETTLFDHSRILRTDGPDHRGAQAARKPPPDSRAVQLGKTVSVLHERLPDLLASPLPQDILSPNISLHLFPSSHPHLPTVSGKIPYTGALWTAPVAWGRLPLLGNVKLDIISERMVRNGGTHIAHQCRDEKLIVKWKTCGKSKEKATALYRGIGATEQLERITRLLGGESNDEEFCGLFIFEFDDQGRIAKHTIEHSEEGGNYDKMNRVVSVTDWLLGKAPWKRQDEPAPGLAFCEQRQHRSRSDRIRHGPK